MSRMVIQNSRAGIRVFLLVALCGNGSNPGHGAFAMMSSDCLPWKLQRTTSLDNDASTTAGGNANTPQEFLQDPENATPLLTVYRARTTPTQSSGKRLAAMAGFACVAIVGLFCLGNATTDKPSSICESCVFECRGENGNVVYREWPASFGRNFSQESWPSRQEMESSRTTAASGRSASAGPSGSFLAATRSESDSTSAQCHDDDTHNCMAKYIQSVFFFQVI